MSTPPLQADRASRAGRPTMHSPPRGDRRASQPSHPAPAPTPDREQQDAVDALERTLAGCTRARTSYRCRMANNQARRRGMAAAAHSVIPLRELALRMPQPSHIPSSEWTGHLREAYIRQASQMADAIAAMVRDGDLTAAQGAELANRARNTLLDRNRQLSGGLAASFARLLKESGYTLANRRDYYANKIFGQTYAALSDAERLGVDRAVVEGAGRTQAFINRFSRTMRVLGRGMAALQTAAAIARIAESDDRSRQTAIELGGTAGGMTAGAAVSFLWTCPETLGWGCVAAGAVTVFGGGYLGSQAGESIGVALHDLFDEDGDFRASHTR